MNQASAPGELDARAQLEQRLASTIAELGAAVAARLDAESTARTLRLELEKATAARADAEQTLARLRAEHRELQAMAARREQAQARRIAALERELALAGTTPAVLRHMSDRERELHRGPRSLAAVPSRPSRAAAQLPPSSPRDEQDRRPRRRRVISVQDRVIRAPTLVAEKRRESPDRSRSQARWLPSETMLGLVLVVFGLTLAILILIGAR